MPQVMHAWHAGEEKRSSEDRARADLQCQQLQQQVHALQTQLQGAQGQVADADRLRMESCVAADRVLEQACQKLSALEPELQCKISQAEKVCACRCIESCVWCLCIFIRHVFKWFVLGCGQSGSNSLVLLACLLVSCPLLETFFQLCFLQDS